MVQQTKRKWLHLGLYWNSEYYSPWRMLWISPHSVTTLTWLPESSMWSSNSKQECNTMNLKKKTEQGRKVNSEGDHHHVHIQLITVLCHWKYLPLPEVKKILVSADTFMAWVDCLYLAAFNNLILRYVKTSFMYGWRKGQKEEFLQL